MTLALLALALSTVLAQACMPSVVNVTTQQQLLAISSCPCCTYILQNNISMTQPLSPEFFILTGSFFGNGYTVSNITFPSNINGKSYGFFPEVLNANIINLELVCAVSAQQIQVVFIGCLAGTITDTIVNSVVVSGVLSLSGNSLNVGGVSGAIYAPAVISNIICSINVTYVTTTVADMSTSPNTRYYGGMFGYVSAQYVDNLQFTGVLNVSDNINIYHLFAGGCVGLSTGILVNVYSSVGVVQVSRDTENQIPTSNLTVGGVAGRCPAIRNSSCTLSNVICRGYCITGGLVGCTTVSNTASMFCYSTANVSVTNAQVQGQVGGLIGIARESVMYSSSSGNVYVEYNQSPTVYAYTEIGGLVGRSTRNIIQCTVYCASVIANCTGYVDLSLGGLVGHLYRDGYTVSAVDCVVHILNLTGMSNYRPVVGGLISYLAGTPQYSASVFNCAVYSFLIQAISNTTIENLSSCRAMSAGFIGYLETTYVANSYVIVDTINASGYGLVYAGGFGGVIRRGSNVLDSFSFVTTINALANYNGSLVDSKGNSVAIIGTAGGFSGEMNTSGNVLRCYSFVTSIKVNVNQTYTGASRSFYVGGFAGNIISSFVRNSFGTALKNFLNLSSSWSTNIYIGGFSGAITQQSSIISSYALLSNFVYSYNGTTAQTASWGGTIGGFSGLIAGLSEVRFCYVILINPFTAAGIRGAAFGTIAGNIVSGILVECFASVGISAQTFGEAPTALTSSWVGILSEQSAVMAFSLFYSSSQSGTNCSGPFASAVLCLTADQMQQSSSFTGWLFGSSDYWSFPAGSQTPILTNVFTGTLTSTTITFSAPECSTQYCWNPSVWSLNSSLFFGLPFTTIMPPFITSGNISSPVNYTCNASYSGNFCRKFTCVNNENCMNGGTCGSNGQCQCLSGFSGVNCGTPLCQYNQEGGFCGGAGTCKEVTPGAMQCVCTTPGYYSTGITCVLGTSDLSGVLYTWGGSIVFCKPGYTGIGNTCIKTASETMLQNMRTAAICLGVIFGFLFVLAVSAFVVLLIKSRSVMIAERGKHVSLDEAPSVRVQ